MSIPKIVLKGTSKISLHERFTQLQKVPNSAVNGGGKSNHSAPSYSAPSYSAPSYSAPSYSAPSYLAPSYSAPSYAPPPKQQTAKRYSAGASYSPPRARARTPDLPRYSSARRNSPVSSRNSRSATVQGASYGRSSSLSGHAYRSPSSFPPGTVYGRAVPQQGGGRSYARASQPLQQYSNWIGRPVTQSAAIVAAAKLKKKSIHQRLGVRPKQLNSSPAWQEPYSIRSRLTRSTSTYSLSRWSSQGSLDNSFSGGSSWGGFRKRWNNFGYGGGGGRGWGRMRRSQSAYNLNGGFARGGQWRFGGSGGGVGGGRGRRGRGGGWGGRRRNWGGGGGGRGGGKNKQPPVSREALDKELDAYMAGTKSVLDKEMDEYMANK